MAKLQRKSAKLFAEQATAGIGGVAQFGSLAAGDPNYSKDPDVIQALDAYKEGWSTAVTGNKSPAIEDRNALDYLLSYQQAYIMQHGVPEWISTETYYQNSYVVDSNGELRVSVIDNNTNNNPALDDGGQYWGYAGARGSGKRVGEVYFSQSSSAADNPGALPLFTGEVISNADQLYPQFYSWVSSHTALCVTEAQWQSRLTQYGECPYYVIDTTAKTIRLPKLTSHIKMANVEQGITQDEGVTGNDFKHYHVFGWNSGNNSGNFVASKINVGGIIPKVDNDTGLRSWNGSGGGGTFGSSSEQYGGNMITTYNTSNLTVCETAHTTVFPWVCAYNAAIPASTAQAAQFQQALSSKVDLASGVSQTDVDYVVENYINGTSWYRVYKSGWCEQGGQAEENAQITFLKPFANTDYGMSGMKLTETSPGGISFDNKTTTSVILRISNDTGGSSPISWQARGYIS